MLKTTVDPLITAIVEANPNEFDMDIVFQQDGAPPHYSRQTEPKPHEPIKDSNSIKSKPCTNNKELPATSKNSTEDKKCNTRSDAKPKVDNPDDKQSEIDESNVNFSQNRELWQRRAILESALASPVLKAHRLSEPYIQRQNHTPDLVMDLPLVGNSSPKEQLTKSLSILNSVYPENSPDKELNPIVPLESGGDSPEMQTAAETFAKQNQCTLKKNKKNHVPDAAEFVTITSPMPERKYATLDSNSTTSTFKPQVESKPLLLKKPVFSVPLRSVSIEMMCKDPPDLPT